MTSRFKRRAVQLGHSCLSLSLLGGCWLCCGSEGVAGVSKGDNSLFLEWKKDWVSDEVKTKDSGCG